MGIDSELFVHTVPQDSYCFLCNAVLENPVQVVECGHCFCVECFEQWKEKNDTNSTLGDETITSPVVEELTCPYCGIDMDYSRVRKSKLVWNLIQNMNVYCKHKSNGCEVTYKYGFHDLHREQCVYEKLKAVENNNNETSSLQVMEKKCPTCKFTLKDSINSHDCTKELTTRVKEQACIVTNLEHENNRLMFKLSTCEKQFLDERTELESQFYLEALRYDKEIRELRTFVASLQAELGVINGQSDIEELNVDIERIKGSLGFNIIGGASKNGDSSGGIFVSRIVEGGAAHQPEKLQLHDQILQVDGIDLRKATHELAVNTFRNSGDPVKMVVRRSVRKLQSGGGDKNKTNFISNNKNEKSNDVVEEVFVTENESSRTNKIHKTVASPSCDVKTNSTSNNSNNRRGWFSPQEISVTSELSSGTDVLVAVLDEKHNGKTNSDGKEEYDSAYDTLMTNKSSRSIQSSSVTVTGVSSDVESTTTTTSNTDCTLAASDNDKVRRRQNTKNRTREQQQDSARENSSDSEKRRSTFFIIPECADGTKTILPTDEYNNNPEADFDYEYKEVTLKKKCGKFGILLCYGGNGADVAVYVGDLEDNSAAEVNGKIMVGDQIVHINGRHVTNVDQAYRMFEENETITLVVARAVYDVPSEFYDEAEETDLDMLDCIAEENELQFASKTSSPTYASSTSSKSSGKNANAAARDLTSIRRSRAKTLSPVDDNIPEELRVSPPRGRSASIEDDLKRLPSASSIVDTSKPPEKEPISKKPSSNSLKNFVKNKLSGQKDKRMGSHSDDSCDFNKLPRCDSNSSTNSNKSQKSRDSSGSKSKTSGSQDVLQARLREQRQQSKLKAYMDSPSLNQNRHRIKTNVSLFQAPYMINNAPVAAFNYQGVSHVTPSIATRPPLTPTPPMNSHLGCRNSMTASVSSLRSAMKNSQMTYPDTRTAKRVQIDPHPGWNDTEKRVWEEFKIIQSMEKENNAENRTDGAPANNIEAEWRVRRSKDGKHVYIKKTNSTRNKILKDRAQEINDERCGITTDDDAFTVYQGQYWNRDQRKKQLNRHNERRKKLLQKAELKANYENKREKEMAELVQRKMTVPVFDNFITIEEILSQRNRAGIMAGPIHVTTI